MTTFTSMSRRRSISIALCALVLVGSNTLFGMPLDPLIEAWNNSKIVDQLYLSSRDARTVDPLVRKLPTFVGRAKAANFSMQTGYYVGNGGTNAVSGLGFQPQVVIIKSDTSAGQAIWKSSAMPANTTAFFAGTAVNTASLITFTANGFTVANNATTNTANVRYNWVAFAGSDCTAAGTLCAGSYSGNGTSPRKITTGFGPALVMVKHSSTTAATFRTSSMAANMGQYFTTTAQVTTGGLFTTLDADGFNVGATINTASNTYYYLAFKAVSGIMAVGSYAGDGLDNKNITGYGVGAVPDFALVKNATSATTANRNPVMNCTHSYGDYSSFISAATANAVNHIQKLQDNGLQVGSSVQVNESAQTIYWAAFGGAPAPAAGADSFDMETGSYTGNGTALNVTGLDSTPDLVIIKDNAANYAVFRTSLMAGNTTAYLANAVANFTTGITSINADGFSIGASTVVNTSGNTYHWQAFGNAYDPITRSGAADFMIGAYMGNGVDNRNVTELPFQPNFVATKRNSTSAGAWRTSAQAGDVSAFFGATAEAANVMQSLQSDSFQVGTNAVANGSGSLYHWFSFKNGDNFTVGSYTGNGTSQTVNVGFQPDLVWVKRTTTASGALHRSSSLVGDATQYFLNTANITSGITGFAATGFTVTGTTAGSNASGGTYRYAAWRKQATGTLTADIVDGSGNSVASPSAQFGNVSAQFSCQSNTGTLGVASQKIRIDNGTANGNWTLTIAATGGSTATWSNGVRTYDYNDTNGTPNGCSDGVDTDSVPGRLTVDASSSTITPGGSCTANGITKGASSGFTEGSVTDVTLLSASGSQTGCVFDLTGVNLSQQIPGETPAHATPYTLNMTITVTAS